MQGLTFAREYVDDVKDEIFGMAKAHNAEAGWLPHEYLDITVDFYLAAEHVGVLRIFTARSPEGQLVGYALFTVSVHAHYRLLVAQQDALYVARPWRRHSLEFMRWTDEQLFVEGVQRIFRASTSRAPYGLVLERMGYERDSVVYARAVPKR